MNCVGLCCTFHYSRTRPAGPGWLAMPPSLRCWQPRQAGAGFFFCVFLFELLPLQVLVALWEFPLPCLSFHVNCVHLCFTLHHSLTRRANRGWLAMPPSLRFWQPRQAGAGFLSCCLCRSLWLAAKQKITCHGLREATSTSRFCWFLQHLRSYIPSVFGTAFGLFHLYDLKKNRRYP